MIHRYDWFARLSVSVGALLPYAPLVTLSHIYITDDGITSDIFNGELPVRVLAARLLASGQAPVWTSQLCSGMPLPTGSVMEPLSLALFSTLRPAPALSLLVIGLLLVAAHGAYTLAQHLGSDRAGAALAGIAFAGSGFMATQLKHLSIISTVVWLPWGLWFLDRALAPARPTVRHSAETADRTLSSLSRVQNLGFFGLVFAEQVASGFPQSAYISALVYGTWAIALLPRLRGRLGPIPLSVALVTCLGAAGVLAVLCGGPTLLPILELSAVSDRHGELSWAFASMLPYSWSDALNFIIPYINGDASDATYHASGLFWENYGYVGLTTLLLALYAVARGLRRPRVVLLLMIGVLAFAFVLGPRTPVFHFFWTHLPGLGRFRFPTRFMFVVDLVLCLLAGVGLGLLRSHLAAFKSGMAPHLPPLVAATLVVVTATDLIIHQSRQNPFVIADEWLAMPTWASAASGSTSARLFTPFHRNFHKMANYMAQGWLDLYPYRELHKFVTPNTGALWGISTADCYAALAPSWHVDVWSDHSRASALVPSLMTLQRDAVRAAPSLAKVLSAFGVTHLTSPLPVVGTRLKEVSGPEGGHLYEVEGERARVVTSARGVRDNAEVAAVLVRPEFDPSREVLLHVPPDEVPPSVEIPSPYVSAGRAVVVEETSRRLVLDVSAPVGGFLLLADTYYPGWSARIDGAAAKVYRANISVRALQLSPGSHTVEFVYDAAPFFRGVALALTGGGALAVWVLATTLAVRRSKKRAGLT